MHRMRLFCSSLRPGVMIVPDDEAHHAVAVLRIRRHDELEMIDGRGGCAPARVIRAEPRRLEVEVGAVDHRPFELPCRLTLAVAMPKAHRQGYLIEKCTELGVAAVQPITTERSVVKPSGSTRTKWQRRAVEAAKQSGRVWVPAIEAVQSLAEAVARAGAFGACALADADDSAPFLAEFLAVRPNLPSLIVAIGPEGGWTESERNSATHAGLATVRLAPTILRTETAAVAVCAAVAMMCRQDP